MIPFGMYTFVVGAVGLAAASYALLRRKPKTPNDLERERRVWLNNVGRITDGTVIDVQEIVPGVHRAATMLIYQYDVAGVSYEASQDVTYLRQWINLHSCRLGLPTSVKYDPHNPGNSMVIAEGWMGLRQ
ncbi:MAG: hypothetical protein HY233_06380 [Acidobacteriales bacterium]|nr:hypothetical protein [Candidatus Koribacter versatilis]MBI3645572.1 hypothetical protein [Terriglobales bacterium]